MNRCAAMLMTWAGLVLLACGGGSGGNRGGDSGVDAGGDAAGDANGTGDAATAGCSEADLDACEYASLELSHTEQGGLSATDEAIGRTIPLLARIPEGEGPFPVLIYSHGGGFSQGGQTRNEDWGSALAGHGYVVIHVGHIPPDAGAGLAWCEAAEVPESECHASQGEEEEDANGLLAVARAHDLMAVLDELPALSALSLANGGPALDLERVGVIGWSGGARGPSLLANARVQPSASAPLFSAPDARVDATVMLSPAGPEFGGYFDDGQDNSWAEMTGPVLVATGQNDVKPDKPGLDGLTRRITFDLQPVDGTRWLLYSNLPVGVGGHPTFNLEHLDHEDERVVRYSRALRSAVLAFFDAHVKDDAAAGDWLESDNAHILAGDVEWMHH